MYVVASSRTPASNRQTYNCKAKRREDGTAGKDSSLFAALGLVQKRTVGPCPPRDGKRVIIGIKEGVRIRNLPLSVRAKPISGQSSVDGRFPETYPGCLRGNKYQCQWVKELSCTCELRLRRGFNYAFWVRFDLSRSLFRSGSFLHHRVMDLRICAHRLLS